MSPFLHCLLFTLLWGTAVASAQQLVTVNPGNLRMAGDSDLRQTLTWRIASRGGASSVRGEFVNLDNNRVLATVEAPLGISTSTGTVREQLHLSSKQARRWYSDGVRQLGYRRTFGGAAGTLSNRVVIDLRFSARLAGLSVSPPRQTLTPGSRQMMLSWDLRGSGLGALEATSAGGDFLHGDRVVYATGQRLSSDGQSRITEVVEIPPGLVAKLLDSGVEQLRYSRTFTDTQKRRRSASVTVNLRL
ncbi:hypothetical protein [Microbulbifer magnicolonia]|uniref:hypothetical protein n=1 Tax=Microbulbifer magnicolonia TaxID=3109744 RepID=UPI002B40C018|nr:hypothetical protein [Microbulbifer sp. GG15]